MDFWEIFLQERQKKDPLHVRLQLTEEATFSFYFSLCPLQDAFRYRARRIALLLAHELIDAEGKIHAKHLAEWASFFDRQTFVFGPDRESDAWIYQHIKNCLQLLVQDPALQAALLKFSVPICHKKAEEYVRQTLWPEELPRSLQTVHVRKAVLTGWLTVLRQTTGSCFATAPAILIQRQAPHRYLHDLYEMLSTGQLKRVFATKQYTVPLSPHLGSGDLLKPLTSMGLLEQFAYCPGMWVALEAAGLFPAATALSDKIETARKRIQRIESAAHAQELLQKILFDELQISEKDVQEEELLGRMQMTALLAKQSAVYYQRPSARAQKVADWKKRCAKAYQAFQALTECALLRCWEYTLASFCDVKVDFARWNLYVGLGLKPETGIGAFLYAYLDQQLQKANEEAARLHQEYEQQITAAHAAQSLVQGAMSHERRNQLKAQWMNQVQAANTLLSLRDQAAAKAETIARFFSQLLHMYDEKLQVDFQEVFDPSLSGLDGDIYDDSPAGFRLVYKHGRSDPTQWTLIQKGEEYLESLREFFTKIETEIVLPPPLDRTFMEKLTTALVQFIQEPSFLRGCFQRAQEHGRRSPWDYLSGGTMQTLLQAYYQREKSFTEAKIVPHTTQELFMFLQQQKKGEPLLIHSPTHAFLFYPHWLPENCAASLQKNRRWLQQISLPEEKQEWLIHRFSEKLQPSERALFLHLFRKEKTPQTKPELRQALIHALQGVRKAPPLRLASWIDSWLYEELPIYSQQEAKQWLQIVLEECRQKGHSFSLPLPSFSGDYVSGAQCLSTIKAFLFQQKPQPFSAIDWDQELVQILRKKGALYPEPLLFADTNWSTWCFGWILNPLTEKLELWRCQRTGTQAIPMHDWEPWLSTQNTLPWVVLTQPHEYR